MIIMVNDVTPPFNWSFTIGSFGCVAMDNTTTHAVSPHHHHHHHMIIIKWLPPDNRHRWMPGSWIMWQRSSLFKSGWIIFLLMSCGIYGWSIQGMCRWVIFRTTLVLCTFRSHHLLDILGCPILILMQPSFLLSNIPKKIHLLHILYNHAPRVSMWAYHHVTSSSSSDTR